MFSEPEVHPSDEIERKFAVTEKNWQNEDVRHNHRGRLEESSDNLEYPWYKDKHDQGHRKDDPEEKDYDKGTHDWRGHRGRHRPDHGLIGFNEQGLKMKRPHRQDNGIKPPHGHDHGVHWPWPHWQDHRMGHNRDSSSNEDSRWYNRDSSSDDDSA